MYFYAILFYFVDYGIPLSQIKIVLFILANRECLIRRRCCINILFIFAGQWKARVICGVLILENYPWCVLPLRSKYWKRDRLPSLSVYDKEHLYLNFLTKIFQKSSLIPRNYKTVIFPQMSTQYLRLSPRIWCQYGTSNPREIFQWGSSEKEIGWWF